MKVWQKPGGREKAEWRCLTQGEWSTQGGTWYKPLVGGGHFLVTVGQSTGEGLPFYGYARWLPADADPVEAVKSGRGHVLQPPMQGRTVKHVRTLLKGLVEARVEEEGFPSLRSLPAIPGDALSFEDHKRKKAFDQARLPYTVGFLEGSNLDSDPPEGAGPQRTGWLHGRDYAIGRAPMPEWLLKSKEEA
jgi:hypothetical protein